MIATTSFGLPIEPEDSQYGKYRLMTLAFLIGATGFVLFIVGVFAASESGERPDQAVLALAGSVILAARIVVMVNRINKERDDE